MSQRSITSPLAEQIRAAAAAYVGTANRERGEGLLQAADMVDYQAGADMARVLKAIDEVRSAILELFKLGPRTGVARPPVSQAAPLSAPPVLAMLPPTTSPAKSAPRAKGPRSASRAGLTPMEIRVLTVLRQRHPRTTSRRQLAITAGYTGRSGTFAAALTALRQAGYMAGPPDGIYATKDGRDVVPDAPALPSPGPELVDYWARELGENTAHAKMLRAFVSVYPHRLTRTKLAEMTGYTGASGSFAAALTKLRALGLVDEWRASADLLESGLARG